MMTFRLAAAVAAFIVSALPAAADIAGSADHPLVGRYEGATITLYEVRDYDEIRLPHTAASRETRETPQAWQTEVSGKVTSIRYEAPGGRSVLEVLRNHEKALKDKGFDVSFFCRGEDECAPRVVPAFWDAGRAGIGLPTTWDTTTYLFAKREAPDGVTWVAIQGVETRATNARPLTTHLAVTVVDGVAMETDRITLVEASAMEEAIARDGRIAIYGITFDFDSAAIRPDSAPQIAELAGLLRDNEALRVLIVGHTDGEGAFDYNLSLSQRRAQAVVDTLTREHGISAQRLTPAGAGMVSPVATNRTEEGRAQNRRVEIVERIGE